VNTITVLVVDDEAALRRVLERALTRRGYRVLLAGSPEDAYQLLHHERPDALLLDIHMPTMSGLALYVAIVSRWPALRDRIAIMTGDAEADEVRAWFAQHSCALLSKPFDLDAVAAWIERVARQRGGQREAGNGRA
jgi:two-component system nitrogen regulation response regulator GlnG